MPLLKALVHAEMTSLEENNRELQEKEGRRVHFSGFDCSSIKPPVESQPGSDIHQSDSIDALIIASHHIGSIIGNKRETGTEHSGVKPSASSALEGMVQFLQDLDGELARACAKVSNLHFF